jgi:hypothetical protein
MLGLTLAGLMVPAGALFAQENEGAAGAAAAGGILAILAGMLLFIGIFALAGYIYKSLALQTISKKTSIGDAWWAWIPILDFALMLKISKKPMWWLIFLIPPLFIALIVIGPLVWMGIAEARMKPNWWGILVIVPLVNIIVPGYLAWAD